MKKQSEKFIRIVLKRDDDYKKFDEFCKKNDLKKAAVFRKFIKEFNRNPQKFLNFN